MAIDKLIPLAAEGIRMLTATKKEAKPKEDTSKEEPKKEEPKKEEPKKEEKEYRNGGTVKSSASKRADGCAQRGKTRGKMV